VPDAARAAEPAPSSVDAAPSVYCLYPAELETRLGRTIARFAAGHGAIAIADRRRIDRRWPGDRRAVPWPGNDAYAPVLERRRIRNDDGRRVAERRATLIPVSAPAPLPRRLRSVAERIVFVEPIELGEEHAEDVDTARLVTRLQAGECDLFATLYNRYFDRIYGYLRVTLHDGHEAEDVTQHVFMRMLENLPNFELRSVPFRAWLFRIVRNDAITHLQRRNRVSVEDPAEIDRLRDHAEADPLDDGVLDWLSDQDLIVLVSRLPLNQRQVIMLRYMLDLTAPEIAAILDRSPESVRQSQARALAFLRSRLSSLGRSKSADIHKALPIRRRMRLAPVASARRLALAGY
jgi:RNA polymerase sigma-70 factor (ECF subfamily)